MLKSIETSIARVQLRQQQKPRARLNPELPFYAHAQELSDAISQHQVVILCGETGSGKTTQLPQLCIDLGLADCGMIGHTQPRRIAAQSVASRIADELQSEVGGAVGYKIRFGDRSSPTSYIKLMTDGILLAEIQHDRMLRQYSTLIIDEAHERSLNIDLLLGYIKQLLPKRPELKIIITSATIDPLQFSRYFNDAPIFNIGGRTYPVEIRYRSPHEDDKDRDQLQALLDAVEELTQVSRQDILVFFPGERQIRDAADRLGKAYARDYDILPLYARLSQGDQQKIFQPHGRCRIVLATNVAETSITVPGIHYVIDTGLARLSRYSWRSRIQRLPIERISKASANQRSGRCGRLAPGICIRLYDEDDFNARPEFTEPEILRTNLASVILQMNLLNLGSINRFDFLESPDSRLINDGYRLLFELRACDRDDHILDLGRKIASLPVDPRLAGMLIRAEQLGCLSEMLIVASALSIQDPRDSSVENRQAAQEHHRVWQHEHSDFLFWPALWSEMKQQQAQLSRNQFARWCRKRYLSYPRIREWQDIHGQLLESLKQSNSRFNSSAADADTLHRAIFNGIPSHIASFDGEKQYLATRERQVLIFPGSGLAKQTPKWIMAFALIETTRLFAHGVARFDPQWAMQDATHLHQYEYYEPHWQARAGRVAAFRNTRIYGLLIEGGKRINFASVDAPQARAIFIQNALVEGDYRTWLEVIRANRKLIDHYAHQEDKHRRRDILISDRQLFDFYDALLPDEAVDAPSFEAWLGRQPAEVIDGLRLTDESLVEQTPDADTAAGFPAQIEKRNQTLKLDYIFDPGNEYDGVSVRIPLMLLNQFKDSDFDHLVPGLLQEKIEALIRSLPRKLRKNFIPAAEFAAACFERMNNEDHLYDALQQALQRMTGVSVARSDWQLEQLDRHLNMHYWLEDGGKCVAQSHSLETLQADFGSRANQSFDAQLKHDESITRSDLIDWDFDLWQTQIVIEKKGHSICAFPALVDYENSVSIELFETRAEADFYHATGVARLIYLQSEKTLKYLRKNLPQIEKTALMYSAIASKTELVEDILCAGIFACFLNDGLPDSRKTFTDCMAQNEKAFVTHVNRLSELANQILTLYHDLKSTLASSTLPTAHRNDMHEQSGHLVYEGFLRDIGISNLARVPAYFQAMQKRLNNFKADSTRLDASLNQIRIFWSDYLTLAEDPQNKVSDITELRWMIEEFRIASFAQPMKTRMPVSVPKIQKLIARIKSNE